MNYASIRIENRFTHYFGERRMRKDGLREFDRGRLESPCDRETVDQFGDLPTDHARPEPQPLRHPDLRFLRPGAGRPVWLHEEVRGLRSAVGKLREAGGEGFVLPGDGGR